MLSVCIPVFNFNITELVKTVHVQLVDLNIDFEIVVADDDSEFHYKKINQQIKSLTNVYYIELEKNIGRSAIRNYLSRVARFNHLLFMDCDSQILSADFISNYVKAIDSTEIVICGGRIYDDKMPEKPFRLRWNYGRRMESLPDSKRNERPYHSFMTNNFIISRTIFNAIQFDEELSGYGHEDTLFGYELFKKKMEIKHIHNPVYHQYAENQEEFLFKTLQALKNLAFIDKKLLNERGFVQMVKLLKVYHLIKKNGLVYPVAILFRLSEPTMRLFFNCKFVGLKVFSLYKLGYYTRLQNQKSLNKS